MDQTVEISRAVVVLGMHRSGTSVLTRSLNALGVYLGNELQPGLPQNQKGFFEDIAIVRLNEDLLKATCGRWDSLVLTPMPGEVSERLHARAVALIRDRFKKSLLWGFKDPRVTRLQPFWHSVISDAGSHPVYVLANRHPLSVAASLEKRDAMPRAQALALWALHQVAGLEAIMRHGGLVVDYDNMLQKSDAQLRRLAGFLSQTFDAGSSDIAAFTEEFLEPNLRNSQHADDSADLGSGSLGTLCQEIHWHLSILAELEASGMHSLVVQGQVLAKRAHQYFSEEAEWLRAIDSLQETHGELLRRYQHLEKTSQSDLMSITEKKSYKAYAAIIGFLKTCKRLITRPS